MCYFPTDLKEIRNIPSVLQSSFLIKRWHSSPEQFLMKTAYQVLKMPPNYRKPSLVFPSWKIGYLWWGSFSNFFHVLRISILNNNLHMHIIFVQTSSRVTYYFFYGTSTSILYLFLYYFGCTPYSPVCSFSSLHRQGWGYTWVLYPDPAET